MRKEEVINFLYQEESFKEFAKDISMSTNLEECTDEELNLLTLLYASWRTGRLKSKAELLGNALGNVGLNSIEIANSELVKAIEANKEILTKDKNIFKRLFK